MNYMFAKYRDEFVLDPQMVFLNSGTWSKTPIRIRQAAETIRESYEINPTESLMKTWRNLWAVQKIVGQHFNARPQQLFLRPNVTFAMDYFIQGIPLPKDGEILVNSWEYGAMVRQCRYRAQASGLQIRSFDFPHEKNWIQNVTSEQLADFLVSQVKPQTRLLLLSHIVSPTGLVWPLEKILAKLKNHEVLVAVDGAHAPGLLKLNFDSWDRLDFYGANFHKWFMGAKGSGFGWIHERHMRSCAPNPVGWSTIDPLPVFTEFGEGNLDSLKMLASSCIDFAPYLVLPKVIEFWQELGFDTVQNYLMEYSNRLQKRIEEELGWFCIRPRANELRSPLVAFELPLTAFWQDPMMAVHLRERHGLQINSFPIQGKNMMRFSPHIYNSPEDIERAVSILKKIQ